MNDAPTNFEEVKHMKAAFGQNLPDEPLEVCDAEFGLIQGLIAEEFKEVFEAMMRLREIGQRPVTKDYTDGMALDAYSDAMEHLAKEFGDLLVVTYGAGAAYGFNMDAVMEEIARSNASKCINGKVVKNAEGKVQKGENYSPADMSCIWES